MSHTQLQDPLEHQCRVFCAALQGYLIAQMLKPDMFIAPRDAVWHARRAVRAAYSQDHNRMFPDYLGHEDPANDRVDDPFKPLVVVPASETPESPNE